MRKILWAGMAYAMLVALGAAVPPASANSIFVTYQTTTPVGSHFDWKYSVTLDNQEKIQTSTACITPGNTA